MIAEFIRRLRTLWRIAGEYDVARTRREAMDRRIDAQHRQLAERIIERTTIHADIGVGPDRPFVILVGEYAGRDYLQVVHLPRGDFQELVKHCKEMRKEGRWITVDAPPVMSAVFRRDIETRSEASTARSLAGSTLTTTLTPIPTATARAADRQQSPENPCSSESTP